VRRPAAIVVLTVALVASALAYLRDPAWLIHQATGLRPPRVTADGMRWRWTDGHASFFVPSDATTVRLPIATSFDPNEPRGDRPVLVTFTIDDRRVARTVLSEAGWQTVSLPLPPPGGRRVRRVDVRASITRGDNRGVQIGDPQVTTDGLHWRNCCFAER